MWAGFIYLFNCACMDQLTLPGLTRMHCWFQTQHGVPPAMPSSAPPHPPHPQPARLPAHSLTRPTVLVYNVDEVYSDCPHVLLSAPTCPCQICAAPLPCVLHCALSDSGPSRHTLCATTVVSYAPPPSRPMCHPCHVHSLPYTSQSTLMHPTSACHHSPTVHTSQPQHAARPQ